MDGSIIIWVVGGFTIITQVGGYIVHTAKSRQAFQDYKEYNDTRYDEFKIDIGKRFDDFKDAIQNTCNAKHKGIDAQIDRIEKIQNNKGK